MQYGVDLGMRRIAVAAPEVGYVADYHLPASVPVERCGAQLAFWLVQAIPPDAQIWVERPFVGRPHGNVRTAISQALTAGGVIARFPDTATLIEQADWKKAVIGNGHASKEQVRDWLLEHHPALAAACQRPDGEYDQDRIDAFCIGFYGDALGGVAPARRVPARRRPRQGV